LASLHQRQPRRDALAALADSDWRAAIDFADRSGLTLLLRRDCSAQLPSWLRDRTDADAAKNLVRLRLTEELHRTLDRRLRACGVEYLALKGLTQCPEYGTAAEDRVQCDADLFVPPDTVQRAGEVVRQMGYEPIEELDRVPTDHLPTFVQKTGWEWRGDFFDPELPLAVELHFQFWNRPVERIAVPDVERFWIRRATQRVAGIEMPVLSAADGLGYTALHLLRHVLRGSARPFHIYEMAGFLERHAADEAFWREWRGAHTPEFRRLQAVMFRLAAEWFGCELGPAAEEEVMRLPAATRAWFEDFALSPAVAIFYPQKDELWLQLSLLHSWRDKLAAARLRLLPMNVPAPVDAIHTPAEAMTLRRRARRWWRFACHMASRLRRHIAALPHAARMGIRWWRKT
jgi:hypothetical protein